MRSSTAERSSWLTITGLPVRLLIEPHQPAIIPPKSTNRGLSHQVVLAGHLPSAHFEKGTRLGVADDSLLHEFNGVTILQRDKPRRTDQVGLLEANAAHLRVVVLVAQKGKDQFKPVGSFRQELPGRLGVRDAMHDQTRIERMN